MSQRTLISLLVCFALLMVMAPAVATPTYLPSGSNQSYGYTSNGQWAVSYINNPAAAGTARKSNNDVNSYQMGILTFGLGGEFGDTDDLFTSIDAQIANIESTTINTNLGGSVAAADAEISTIVDGINTTLQEIDTNGYGKAYTGFHAPFFPLVIATELLGGTWVFDINAAATAKVEVLHQDIVFNGLLAANDDIEIISTDPTLPVEFRVNSDTTLLVRAAAVAEVSIGYGTKLFPLPVGELYFGVRGKYYRVGLIQVNERFGDYLSTTNTGSQSSFENIDNNDFTDSTGFGVDVGVLWHMANMQLGATIENVNEPSFEYKPINFTGSNYDINGIVAQKLMALSNYTMQSQVKFEASLNSESKLFALNASLDANSVTDPFGDEYQWAVANLSFNINSWFLPDLRVGYRANLAGSELSYATVGLSAFKMLTVDAAYGLEEVIIDGETAPRSFAVNIGFQLSF